MAAQSALRPGRRCCTWKKSVRLPKPLSCGPWTVTSSVTFLADFSPPASQSGRRYPAKTPLFIACSTSAQRVLPAPNHRGCFHRSVRFLQESLESRNMLLVESDSRERHRNPQAFIMFGKRAHLRFAAKQNGSPYCRERRPWRSAFARNRGTAQRPFPTELGDLARRSRNQFSLRGWPQRVTKNTKKRHQSGTSFLCFFVTFCGQETFVCENLCATQRN